MMSAASAALLDAQTFSGFITGTVADPSGAAVPHTRVGLTHLQTNQSSVAISNAVGEYRSTPLPPGDYRLEAAAPGFKVFVQTGIRLEVGQTAVMNLNLAVGAEVESIQVSADAPLLEAGTSDLGKVVDNRRIRDLPLNTRNVFSMVALTPGFIGTTNTQFDSQSFAVYGSRTRMMEIVVDGVSANVPGITGYAATSSFPPVDAIQEFKVMGANPPADYGRSLGTVLNIVYKSGTNQMHGSAFNFLRNSVFDANNFFANSRGEPLASFKRNQFGGTASGPIRRDKTFFMGSYEGLRERRFQNLLTTVPTERERRGDFTRTRDRNNQLVQIFDRFSSTSARTPFAGNVIPGDRFDPVAVNAIRYYPLPIMRAIQSLTSRTTAKAEPSGSTSTTGTPGSIIS
jgi:hypothetical protein